MIEITVPSPGESISEVEIGSWQKANGEFVHKGQEVALIESEKATLEVNAPESGILHILVEAGERIAVGTVIARIEPGGISGDNNESPQIPAVKPEEAKNNQPDAPKSQENSPDPVSNPESQVKVTPVAKKIMEANDLNLEEVLQGLRRITKADVELVIENRTRSTKTEPAVAGNDLIRSENRKRMSLLRSKLSERLVAVKQETAMLTTFNEIDMFEVMQLRSTYKGEFEKVHGVKLGFMSFFTMAATRALLSFPQVNSVIDGDDIVAFDYTDIGIAVQTSKGLMVPVLRDTHKMSLADLEISIAALARKARDNRIGLEDLKGGTFSITNGGVFGSLMSTPILNPPQPAILGMHNIVDRPVALHGHVVIRPMMYVALSYDHRLIDGKDSVGFLKMIKDLIENPMKLLGPAGNPERALMGI